MSTDDSVSEDVSSSGPLSHCHVSADGDGGKESEASLVSSEGTSASGLAVSEDRHAAPQTTGGVVESRATDITPACNKIRSLCLSTEEAFEQGKSLPFINPSSLETLRALVQEIQSSGETDPEIWKDCEGRWLHLFQLVEKQYQEQILAQQEQYQCQIQLIQDEIKALVQLQNRQPHPEVIKGGGGDAKHYIFPLLTADCGAPRTAASDSDSLAAPALLSPFSSPSPPPLRPGGAAEERATTVLSSGYGTLSAWETGPEAAESPGDEEEHRPDKRWFPDLQEDAEAPAPGPSPEAEERALTASRAGQPLTSWAQRQKLRARKSKAAQAPPPVMPEHLEPPPPHSTDAEFQQRVGGPGCGSLPLRRSDSLMSEASGLTYWRLNEQDLYHPLPDSFDSSAFLLLQEASSSPSPEPRLSLREIYHSKQRGDSRRPEWEGPQLSTLEPTGNARQSDRTSGFTSPSHFGSPSPGAGQRPPTPPASGASESPDGAAEGGLNPGDADGISDTSSISAAGPPTANARTPEARGFWTNGPDRQRQRQGSEEDAASHTHTSTLKQGSSLDDPVVLSLLRQNLRDKHSRHVADLKAYYESEIQSLRQKLKLRDLPQDLERSNQALTERCQHLEEALAEATGRVQELEAANASLEKKLAEWPERYAVAGAAVKSLQQRLEENKRSAKEKEAAAARLKARVRQLEEAAQRAGREADEREARRDREYKMLQDLLAEYDALAKQHEGVKSNLVSTEDKLVAASDQICELKRIISKLESQVKQLEHENQARLRHTSHGTTQPSGAGLFHHPDLLLPPGQPEPDAARRKSPCQGAEPLHGAKRLSFRKRSPRAPSEQSSGSSADAPSTVGSWRCVSPPECEAAPLRHGEAGGGGRRDGSCAMTPMMRALIELEETRATQSRAPWVCGQRTTVGFVELRHKEPIQERAGLQDSRDRGGGGAGGGAGAARSLLRPQRSLSPEGLRSSSLPPTAQRSVPATTPTKRETLLAPLSAKSSPKRCPTENFSTAFGHMMPREEHLHRRFDGQLDQRRHSFHSGSPRKRLHFASAECERAEEQEVAVAVAALSGAAPAPIPALGGGDSQLAWEEPRPAPPDDSQPLLTDRLHSLAEAEKLLDELTQEKLQVEAALSRLPGSGGRVSIQTRLDEVALEKRLERLNRELGSLRMTLKRFHVLRSSANI